MNQLTRRPRDSASCSMRASDIAPPLHGYTMHVKPRKHLSSNTPYNDLDLSRWKDYREIWTDSLWDIPSRARGNGHALEYHGNFVPQIATQTFLRFTKADDVV